VTCPVAAACRSLPPPGTGPSVPDGYRELMGRIFLILIAALVVVMVVSAIIATLHLLFVIALIAVVVIGALRLSRGVRRRADR
jgi:Flp pilus assembly protein TadB